MKYPIVAANGVFVGAICGVADFPLWGGVLCAVISCILMIAYAHALVAA